MNMKRLLTLFTASFLAFTAHSASAIDPNNGDLNQETSAISSQSKYAAFKEDINHTLGVGTLKSGVKNILSAPKHLYMSLSQGAEAMHAMSSFFLWPKVPVLAAQSTWNFANGIFKAPLGITQTALGGTLAFAHQMKKHPRKTAMAMGSAAALGYTLANHPDLVLKAATATIKATGYTGAAALGATSFTASHLMELWGSAFKTSSTPTMQLMGEAMSGSASLFSTLSSLCFSVFGE